MSVYANNIANDLYNHFININNKDLIKNKIENYIYLLLYNYFENYYNNSIYLSKLFIEDDIKYYQREFYLILIKNIRISYNTYKKYIMNIWINISYIYNNKNQHKRLRKIFK